MAAAAAGPIAQAVGDLLGSITDSVQKGVTATQDRELKKDIATVDFAQKDAYAVLANQQFLAQQAFERSQLERASALQYANVDRNLNFLSTAAQQAGVPIWQILSGKVPDVSYQLLGSNFARTPAGADPFRYNQWIPTPNAGLSPVATMVTQGGFSNPLGWASWKGDMASTPTGAWLTSQPAKPLAKVAPMTTTTPTEYGVYRP